jgi:glycosyltransferase involved in cell wall biosynthesis
VKLLLITGIFPPDIGGPATYVPLLAEEACNRYQSVSVVTLGNESRHTITKNYEIFCISRAFPKPIRILKTALVLLREARNSDAIFCNGLYIETAIVLRLIRRRSVAKIVGDPVWEKARNSSRTSLDINDFQSSNWAKKDKLVNLIFCKAWNSFDILTCPSPALVELIESRIPKKTVIYIPNGVDAPSENKPKEECTLITVSRLVSWKNIQCVIEASSILGYKLIIIGDGPERLMLEKLAKEKNTNATFMGNLSAQEVRRHLEKVSYFLQVSDYEGLSFSLLEAMACGVVPIVSGNDGNKIVVQDHVNGVITKIDGSSIAQAIQKIQDHPGLYERLSNEAIRTVNEKFKGKSNRSKMLDLLDPIK